MQALPYRNTITGAPINSSHCRKLEHSQITEIRVAYWQVIQKQNLIYLPGSVW